jgi:RHS repeat-associated protein
MKSKIHNFHFKIVARSKKALYLLICFPFMVIGQTTSQNYVKTTNYKVATTVVAEPSAAQKSVTVAYVDGLGRPVQQIAHQQSGTGKDIVTHMEYDVYGRPVKEYLPYVKTSGASDLSFIGLAHAETLSYYTSTNPVTTGNPNFDITTNPYSEKLFESSPLNRVLKQGAPGNPWALSGNANPDHSVKFDYQTNITSDNVKVYRATATWSPTQLVYNIAFSQTGSTTYSEGQLYKTITKDENWTSGTNHTTEEYKDKEGKVILKRTYGVSVVNNVPTNTTHDTYYVYDQYGNLTYVLPPLSTNVTTDLEGLCYQYKYDYRNRLVEKKLPGKQWEYIIYDKLDRVVATGPALSPFTNATVNTYGWMVTKYDVFNRPVYTGWQLESTAFSQSLRTSKQTTITGLTALNESKVASFTVDGVDIRYTNSVTLFSTAFTLLTVTYYDDYSFPSPPPNYNDVETQQVYYTATTNKPKGLATGNWVRIVEASTAPIRAEKSYTLYDYKARPIRNYTTNYLVGSTQVDTKYDFVKTLHTVTKHKRLALSTEVVIKDEFTYTTQDRLLTHTQQINALPKQLLVKNEYDELGQLIVKRVGGTDVTTYAGLQKVDYAYNVRGWLKGINIADDGTTNPLQQGSAPKDLFAFKINYNLVEGGVAGVQALHNGNISETYWRTSSDNVLRKYGYVYDQMNRLNEAIYQKPGLSTPTNSYNESVSYDKNGNIKALQRNGDLDSNTFTIEMDDLVYSYSTTQPNQLSAVEDLTNHPQGFKDSATNGIDFTYDANGNMLTDANKEITGIKYNHLNLPTEILFNGTNKKINYLYTAAGVKVEKKVTNGSTVTTTDYLSGFQYTKVNSGNVTMDFFPHAEGYVACTLSGSNPLFNYVYNYTDHLGNIRVSYTWDTATTSLKILEENHYFPFGLKHTKYNRDTYQYVTTEEGGYNTGTIGRINNPENALYKYKYNGKELQDELGLNMYDYGARNYDPALGRWMNIDPLAEKYRKWSPYTYCIDNPIRFLDPDGMRVWIYYQETDKSGKSKNIGVEYRKDGKLYDEKGKLYKGDNSYVQKVSEDLTQLRKESDVLNKMIESLIGGKNHNIRMADKDKGNDSDPIDKVGVREGKKSGTNIGYDPDNYKTVGGDIRTPRVGLAHEISHSFNTENGLRKKGTTDNGVKLEEVDAVNTENIIREVLNEPKRKEYGGIPIPDELLINRTL